MTNIIDKILKWGVVSLLSLILYKSCDNSELNELKKQNEFLKIQSDSLNVKFNNADSTYTYFKSIYQGTQSDLELLKKSDADLYKLAKDKKVTTTIVTKVEARVDTVFKPQYVYLDSLGSEVREGHVKTSDYEASIKSTKDSFDVSLKAKSDLEITLDKNGLLKVTPSANWLTVGDIKGYTKVEKSRKSTKWIYAGVGALVGGYSIFKLNK